MTARLDQFVDVLLREKADQLYLLPDEPVTIVVNGRPRKVTKQPLTDQHIYALLVEVAPSDAADKIDQRAETEFHYAASRGLTRIRVVPEGQRLTAVISPAPREAPAAAAGGGRGRPSAGGPLAPAGPAPRAPRPSAIAAAPFVADPLPMPAAAPAPPAALPGEFAASQYDGAEQRLRDVLGALVRSGSSDLHLRVGEPVIFRTHGELQREDGAPLTTGDIELMLLAVMPEASRAEWKETGDTDFAYEVPGLARFRCNAARERRGPAAAIRVIPGEIVSADALELPDAVRALCYLPRGLVLVTGPTGSGKSTTVCALVDLMNRDRSSHIVTIEDPIEFVHDSRRSVVTQRQVRLHTESYRTAVRAVVREDPDVVVLGELRDPDTVALALETAETGHLVLATMRTNTATATVDRLLDPFPPERQASMRGLLAESLRGVIAQTLCRKIGGGRIAAREILLVTPAIANLIREGKTFQIAPLMQASRRSGMVTLNDALMGLVEQGLVEPSEAYLRAVEKAGFAAALKQKRIRLVGVD